MSFFRGRTIAVALAFAFAAGATQAQVRPKPQLSEPALSPDGREIAFASGGDIWTVPAAGGTASLLVTDPATEARPLWSPDGREIAFTSNRNGPTNVYVLTLATGRLRRLTWDDAGDTLDGWSRDGKWIYFTSGAGDVARNGDIWRVAASGGTPLELSRERYIAEFHSAPAPDGQSIALMAKGISATQWWRNGHSHIDEAELWVKPVAQGGAYRRLLGQSSKRLWPMWRPDGRALYFMSDETGTENLWRMGLEAGAKPEQVTRFTEGRVLWPSIAYDGRAIVFERGFSIWKLDTATGQVAEVPIALRGSPAGAGERRLAETSFRSLAVSPDGKKVAVIAHGEVFAAPAKDGGTGQRITETVGPESDIVWSPDSRKLAYVSERGLGSQVMEYDFATGRERALTSGPGYAYAPQYSPDGKSLTYARGFQELHVLSLEGPPRDLTLFKGALALTGTGRVAWSPDSKWIAFPITDRRSFVNVHLVPASGGEPRPVSFLANGNIGDSIAWSPDGTFILFSTSQRSEEIKIARVDLLPHTPKYREDAFRDLFKTPGAPEVPKSPDDSETPEKTPVSEGQARTAAANRKADEKPPAAAAKPIVPPVRIVFEGIRERTSFLPLGVSADEPVISPDGKLLVFRARFGDAQNLYSWSLDELAKEPPSPEQVSGGKRPKSDWSFTADSKQLFYLDGGRVTATPLEKPAPKAIDVTGEMVARFDAEKAIVFDQAWSTLNRLFYDPKFHGADWQSLRERYAPYAAGAQTSDELRRGINLMIGELNASHSGIQRPPTGFGSAPAPRVGDLGLRFDREAYEAGRGLVIREVIELGPAFIEGTIKVGESLVAVDGRPLGPDVNLDSLLVDRIGKRVVLTIAAAGGARREAVVRPVSGTTAAGLLYRAWVKDRRAYVDRVSGGRLGYVHIADMSADSLNQLYIDLDSQNQGKDGVVIDVRNNNGGFVNGYVLDVFTRKNFLTMTPRDLFGVPSRQNLGQRALGKPTILVTNESSLSDAEDFTEGYRYLGLGKVVGTPTAGWIIYTGGQGLIDGSTLRTPFIRIEGADGKNMELNPRPVDVMVERQLGETLAGKDSQLDAAVSELLKGLGPSR